MKYHRDKTDTKKVQAIQQTIKLMIEDIEDIKKRLNVKKSLMEARIDNYYSKPTDLTSGQEELLEELEESVERIEGDEDWLEELEDSLDSILSIDWNEYIDNTFLI